MLLATTTLGVVLTLPCVHPLVLLLVLLPPPLLLLMLLLLLPTQPLELLKTRFQLNEGKPMRVLPAVRGESGSQGVKGDEHTHMALQPDTNILASSWRLTRALCATPFPDSNPGSCVTQPINYWFCVVCLCAGCCHPPSPH